MEDLLKLLIAAIIGGLIGIERQIGGQTAGFRTQLLVCLGSCLFTITSVQIYKTYGSPADPGRIAAQIVVGIGFLGAGAILRHGISIRGLTTAATLWMVSAIGMAVGFGKYLIACFAAILVLFILAVLKNIEDILPVNRYAVLKFKLSGTEELRLSDMLDGYQIKIVETRSRFLNRQNIIEQEASIRYKDPKQLEMFIKKIRELSSIIELEKS